MVRRHEIVADVVYITRWFKTKQFTLDEIEYIEFPIPDPNSEGKVGFGLEFYMYQTSRFFFWKAKHPEFKKFRPSLEVDLDLLTSEFLQELKDVADQHSVEFRNYSEAQRALAKREISR